MNRFVVVTLLFGLVLDAPRRLVPRILLDLIVVGVSERRERCSGLVVACVARGAAVASGEPAARGARVARGGGAPTHDHRGSPLRDHHHPTAGVPLTHAFCACTLLVLPSALLRLARATRSRARFGVQRELLEAELKSAQRELKLAIERLEAEHKESVRLRESVESERREALHLRETIEKLRLEASNSRVDVERSLKEVRVQCIEFIVRIHSCAVCFSPYPIIDQNTDNECVDSLRCAARGGARHAGARGALSDARLDEREGAAHRAPARRVARQQRALSARGR